MPVIEKRLLKNLKKYKYSGVDKSLLSKYVLQPYWNWLVTLFPTWSCPNLITLTGFVCIIVNLVTLLYYSPELSTPAPNWVYFSCAAGLWIYQSLDAIDGKQARRTGTSSPLGQLFDHGCDALNTGFGAIIAFSALGMTGNWISIMSFLISLANFYLSTWEEFHTGTLYLGYFSGPVEGVVTLIAVYLWSGFKGPQWWNQSCFNVFPFLKQFRSLPDMAMNTFFVFTCLGIVLAILFSCLMSVWNATKNDRKKSFGKALLGLLPFVVLSFTMMVWIDVAPILLKKYFPGLLLLYGIAFGNMVGRMIVAHSVHDQFPHTHEVYTPLILNSVVFTVAKYFFPQALPWLTVNIHIFLYFSLATVCAIHLRFVFGVIYEICDYLDINCLTIKSASKPPASDAKPASSGRRASRGTRKSK